MTVAGATLRPTAGELLGCCASTAWVAAVLAEAPYPGFEDLLRRGAEIWWRLGPDDWREAFAAHPRIGERPPAGSQEHGEQSAARGAAPQVLAALHAGNVAYEERFGMTYLVRASGRSAEEMLALLRDRLGNTPDRELHVAAGQQWEITALRLRRRYADPDTASGPA